MDRAGLNGTGSQHHAPPSKRYNRLMNQEVFAALSDALQQGEEVALVTIVASTGSTPQRVGAKMLVYADGRTVGMTRSGKRAKRSRAAGRSP